jgi:dihydrodipicolinate synthase/N-acetylneuraminate lyase
LPFDYLPRETAVQEIVRDCCNSIWNCLTTTEMPKKTEDNWMNVANYFVEECNSQLALVLWMGNTLE